MTDFEPYCDPIISLVQDPNLSKDKFKSSQLVKLIQNISERRINKLCSTSFVILQTLENIQLKFKSWEFLSLDFNSDKHFTNEDDHIKEFNAGIANKVITACTEINVKIAKISSDVDIISKSSKTLTPRDLMSDAGTMLTSLLLRIIKMKNEVIEQLSISYSKARLIIIGEELEMWEDEQTVAYYKDFISTLLNQLNDAIKMDDYDSKYECLAVINDLEKMFEKLRMEKIIDETIEESRIEQEEHDYNFDSQMDTLESQVDFYVKQPSSPPDDTFSEYSTFSTSPHLPMVRSITSAKDQDLGGFQGTITDELPYLMTAFSAARNINQDVKYFMAKGKNSR
ncbi:hypothetical protein SBY92_004066 [Candida maltosa Xu316]|uniref:Uncharacterized protein n=1 Tax=Candida maltosa (strain Xu316) TaxID=1245528 RepID=M3IQK9_CANMX|nr:hypothetical protein G210_0613 [Candida maltosa Xu316]